MDALNRIVVVALVLLLLVLVMAVALMPAETLNSGQQLLAQGSRVLTEAQGSQRLALNAGRAVLAFLAVILALLIVRVEFRRREPRSVKVKGSSEGAASVTADSVSRRLVWHIDQLADVISVTPEVKARGGSVDVRLQLETRPEIDVPMKTDEVIAVAREVVTERMGLQLGKIEVRVKHVAYDESI